MRNLQHCRSLGFWISWFGIDLAGDMSMFRELSGSVESILECSLHPIEHLAGCLLSSRLAAFRSGGLSAHVPRSGRWKPRPRAERFLVAMAERSV